MAGEVEEEHGETTELETHLGTRRESALKRDTLSRHKNKVRSKTCESPKEFTRRGEYVHLRHKHGIPRSGRSFRKAESCSPEFL